MQLKRIIGMLAAVSIFVMFAGCGQKGGSTAPQVSQNNGAGQKIVESAGMYPEPIMRGLDDPKLANTIYTIGIGQMRGDLVLAKRNADARADAQIASVFEQHIGEIYKEFRAATNNDVEKHIQDAIIAKTNQTISGTLELPRYTARETAADGTVTIYVIKYIAGQELLNAMNNVIDQLQNSNPNKNLATQLRANKSYSEVDEMMRSGKALEAM